ncbi:dead-box ATP-dependent RNA helicase 38 [Phtheirospermum japonicum]|uniref:RNA helicase n=1 Tax=Phtheirospermum japonicum TaxID=374723 RepID=A0A830BA41_9LAMI|nr:dead-box ATP-dependent RNA helicase 38 [Phtheirospermum japonicum]
MVTSGDTPYASAKRFEDLNLSPELLKGLYVEMRFEKPSKIQAISLPMILTPPHKNLIAQAHNGSGKTTCFVLGMLSRVDPQIKAPQALCICPTREIAIQNMEVLLKMGKFSGITSELAIKADSANYIPSRKRPPITAQVIIGTPGTIRNMKTLDMSQMKILGGFKDDSVRIMKAIAQANLNCQVLLFSATFDDAVRAFVTKIVEGIFVRDYNQMFVKKEELSLESVKQYKVHCPDEHSKRAVIKHQILELGDKVGQTIVFVQTRNSASMLHKSLVEMGYEVTTIHGALKTEDRDNIIKEFKEGLTHVLISTDLLARGFDQEQVNLVVNYDLPVVYNRHSEPDFEVYLHRVGAVFNLLCEDIDDQIMGKIEKYFDTQITEVSPWDSEKEFRVALENAGEEAAKDALVYSYKVLFAFAAKLTPDQATRLQNQPNISQVIEEDVKYWLDDGSDD